MPLFLFAGFVGVIFSIVGYILTRRPPKRINFWYGYRTLGSIRSQERWDFAQVYSAKRLFSGGIFLIVVSLISLLPFGFDIMTEVIITLVLVAGIPIWIIVSTEIELKKRFGNKK